jgi:plastocyanin
MTRRRTLMQLRRTEAAVLMAAFVATVAVTTSCTHAGSVGHKATGAVASSPATAPVISIRSFAFQPSELVVSPGEMVAVHNDDSAAHTVTAAAPHAGIFDTGDISPGSTATFRAPDSPGSYPFICTIHQFMHGTLIVRGH